MRGIDVENLDGNGIKTCLTAFKKNVHSCSNNP